jgi:hypothetical protein
MLRSRLLLIFVGLLFAGGILLQLVHVPNVAEGVVGEGIASGDLVKKFPNNSGNWIGRDEPLGPNESVAGAAARILNFDDYAYRIYRKGNRSIGVYVAYWAAGRMPTHKVASHTPDRCWTENGWKCDDMKFAVPVAFGGQALKPAEWRKFTPPGGGGTQYVLYWHLVGDEIYDYGERFNSRPHPIKWVRDSIAYAMKGSREQYFIRLTSDQPVENLLSDPELAPVMQMLASLGLRLDPATPDSKPEA